MLALSARLKSTIRKPSFHFAPGWQRDESETLKRSTCYSPKVRPLRIPLFIDYVSDFVVLEFLSLSQTSHSDLPIVVVLDETVCAKCAIAIKLLRNPLIAPLLEVTPRCLTTFRHYESRQALENSATVCPLCQTVLRKLDGALQNGLPSSYELGQTSVSVYKYFLSGGCFRMNLKYSLRNDDSDQCLSDVVVEFQERRRVEFTSHVSKSTFPPS